MKKFTLLIASLFIAIGAMAQAELDGKYVTFTNVQQDGTERSLYVNTSGALTISNDPATSLGEYALFKCELQDNGKYTFFNEKANVYMIWRNAGTGGYDGGDGTMASYNETYCDWTLNASTNYSGGYYIVSKRANGTTDGSLIIMATGVFDAYGNSEGWSGTYSNVFKIEEATVAETIDITYEFTYNGVVKEDYTHVASATVGEVFPAFMVEFPYGITATKPEGNVEASYEGQTFTIELEENLPFVAADSYENITHWYYMTIHTTVKYLYHEAGQTNIPLTVATKPAAEAKYAWAFVGNPFDGYRIYNYAAGADMVLSSSTTMAGTDGGGTYPVMTALPVADGNNELLWVATASSHGTNGFFLAQKGFANNRMNNRDNKLAYWTGGADAGSTFQVSRCIVPGGYYRISYDNSGTEYYMQGVASSVKGCAFTTETDAKSIWYYGNNRLLSYTAGKYFKEAGEERGLQGIGVEGGNVTITTSSRNASKYNIACTSYLHFNSSGSNYFSDHCTGNNCAEHDMILKNVMSLPVTISAAGFATLYAPVALKVADGLVAYTVTLNGQWATLNKIESGVIPANTGVVLAGEVVDNEVTPATADTYDFVVTTTDATVASDLRGSAPAAYYTEAGTYYALAQLNGKVGFYKDAFNNSRFQNNSHKAYLYVAGGAETASYSFRFGEGTTGINEVKGENGNVKAIFDLTGRRVENISAPGIYIVNGKKVLVK